MKKGVCLLLAAAVFLGGCKIPVFSEQEDKAVKTEEGTYSVYYMNVDETGLLKEAVNTKAEEDDTKAVVEELLDILENEKPKEDMQALLPKDVRMNSYELRRDRVVIDFHKSYRKMQKVREILARAGIVKTLIQVPGIQEVEFTVDGEALVDSKGDPVGGMSVNTFVEHAGTDINNYQYTTLTLYFTNKEGDKLIPESRSVYYSSNLPLERVVIEQLLKGPREKGVRPTLPEKANLLSVTISENICYVNFDEMFVDGALAIQESIPVYSIANSLIDACKVKSVQISVNGENKMTFRETMDLSKFYKKSEKLIASEPA